MVLSEVGAVQQGVKHKIDKKEIKMPSKDLKFAGEAVFEAINYPAAELRGIKTQNLFPSCHSCGSRNPVFPSFSGPPLSRE